ncbi:MAG TPA: acylneuraminate cytidylyltransferase family protein [Solirubrobacteraceae bacterium]|jgi:CMP-N-acetylneuraminic acid synthetase
MPTHTSSKRPAASEVNFGLIPARGGSEGVPNKNLRPLAGIPLVAHSILSAQASGVFNDVYVSTDDDEIAEVAAAYDARVIARPADLGHAQTPMAPVIEHAIEWLSVRQAAPPENLFLLQPTSPLRSAIDIREAAQILAGESCESVMGVFEADDPHQWSLSIDREGLLRPAFAREEYLARRQDLKPTYFDGPIHAIRTAAFLRAKSFLTDRTRCFVVPRARAIDIDTEIDFLFAEFLFSRIRES